MGGDGGVDDQLDHILADLLQRDIGAVLGGQHHGVHADGCAVLIVLHGDLGLTVRTEIVHQTLLAHIGQALGHLVGDGDSQRHQFRRLVAGVAEHHALVAGAVVQLALALGLGLVAPVHAQRDVAGLLVDVGDDGAGVAVKAVLGAVVADVQHHLTGDLGDIHIAVGGDLTHDVDQAGGGAGLAGHAAIGVLLKDRVQHRVGDLVADLIGMPLGNGFRSKQMSCHDNFSFLLGTRNKKALCRTDRVLKLSCLPSSFDSFAGFGTLKKQVAVASSGRSLRHS